MSNVRSRALRAARGRAAKDSGELLEAEARVWINRNLGRSQSWTRYVEGENLVVLEDQDRTADEIPVRLAFSMCTHPEIRGTLDVPRYAPEYGYMAAGGRARGGWLSGPRLSGLKDLGEAIRAYEETIAQRSTMAQADAPWEAIELAKLLRRSGAYLASSGSVFALMIGNTTVTVFNPGGRMIL